jgi:ATP-dependent exoDNAse (exonuclease V) beta subunit
VRVTYVAATRARELLVVPVVGDEERSGWLDVLNPVVYPDRARKRAPRPAPGCPAFGNESVLDRGPQGRAPAGGSVAPGLHAPQEGSHGVVWWDPGALELDREEQVGLRQERILVADEDGRVAEEGTRAHEAWQEARRRTLAAGATPAIDVQPVTGMLREVPAGAVPVRRESVPGDRAGRPGGRRFGSLVHAVLAAVPLRGDAAAVARAARAQGRLVGATPEEVAAAAAAVAAALRHPILERAARAQGRGALRRETPVLHRRPDGVLAEGVVDLAFREDSEVGPRWTVVDFKTDREVGAESARYEAQVALYVQAIEAATEEPAEGVLLLV